MAPGRFGCLININYSQICLAHRSLRRRMDCRLGPVSSKAKRSVRNPIKCVDKIKLPPPKNQHQIAHLATRVLAAVERLEGMMLLVQVGRLDRSLSPLRVELSSDFDDYLMWMPDWPIKTVKCEIIILLMCSLFIAPITAVHPHHQPTLFLWMDEVLV